MSGVSMEEFGPVSADYFNGKRVTKVTSKNSKGGGFIIHFEGGGEIHNFDDETPMPKAINGAALTMTIFNSTDKTTTLRFGLEEVVLNPMAYAIKDDNYTDGKLVYPQSSLANDLPSDLPDEPTERLAEGPDEEWAAAQEERVHEEDGA